jgi:hypothetical protein
MNIPRYNEDFGQTLGVWGAASGPYLVLPLFGPSSGRDAVGLVVDSYSDPWYRFTLASQFNTTTVGSGEPPAEKPVDISALEFDYTYPDESLAFAKTNGMMLEGATGGWHTNNPLWITNGTHDELKTYLERKIESDISHYGGTVLYWGVFNEVLDSDGVSFQVKRSSDTAKLACLVSITTAPFPISLLSAGAAPGSALPTHPFHRSCRLLPGHTIFAVGSFPALPRRMNVPDPTGEPTTAATARPRTSKIIARGSAPVMTPGIRRCGKRSYPLLLSQAIDRSIFRSSAVATIAEVLTRYASAPWDATLLVKVPVNGARF